LASTSLWVHLAWAHARAGWLEEALWSFRRLGHLAKDAGSASVVRRRLDETLHPHLGAWWCLRRLGREGEARDARGLAYRTDVPSHELDAWFQREQP
jgi:hypothetical protein